MIFTVDNYTQMEVRPKMDVVLVSGDYWADHPHSGIGVIARVLSDHGYQVGIIEKPDWTTTVDFKIFGIPRLFFGVSSGAIDSMLVNYTPLKKERAKDPYRPFISNIPDRAVIVYCQMIRSALNEMLKETAPNPIKRRPAIILGGVEASLRRFAHYDYWDNKLRRSILIDAKADLLVYGPGEFQVIEIATRLKNLQLLSGIEGTAEIVPNWLDWIEQARQDRRRFTLLPSFQNISQDKEEYCKMQMTFSNEMNLIQSFGTRGVVQYQMHPYSTEELDELYVRDFSYEIPEKFHEFEMAQFSIMTHRGCFGNCNFCSIALHQGTKIISRSEDNILNEIRILTNHPEFKGNISDLGGPSANMYGMDCENRGTCRRSDCLICPNNKKSHARITSLLKKSRMIPNVKKVFVRSGVRYDIAVDDDIYLEELCQNHISGVLKIAPEHFSPKVCELMNKKTEKFEEFRQKFVKYAAPNCALKYYFITAHPGSTMEDAKFLASKIKELGYENTDSIQIYTPTPMSISSCMYYTGLDPFTLKPIYVPYSYNEKKEQKRILYPSQIAKITKKTPNKYSKKNLKKKSQSNVSKGNPKKKHKN